MSASPRPLRGRRWSLRWLAVSALLVALAAVPVFANLPGSSFDAGDANLVVDGSEQDWAGVATASGDPFAFRKRDDLLKGQGDNAFGNGTSEDTAVPSLVTDGIPPNKSDITRFLKAHETIGNSLFLYLGWERKEDPTGTTNFDFELNKSTTISSNGLTPVRSPGDVLIKYDLANGGTTPVLGFHRWITGGSGSAGSLCEANSKFPCWDKVHPISGANFEAAINSDPVSDPIAPPTGGQTLDPRTFGEAAINLTGAGIITDPCAGFAKAYLKSRSSDAFNSAIKDVSAPLDADIQNCATVGVTKTGSSGPVADQAGAVFTLTGPNSFSATCTVNTLGNCVTPNTTTNPFTQLSPGTYTIDETTVPTGFTKPTCQQPNTTNAGCLPYTFTLVGGQTLNLSFTDNAQPGSILVRKVDDTGAGVGGATFALYSPQGIAAGPPKVPTGNPVAGKSCTTATTTDANATPPTVKGECTIGGVDAGNYTIDETVVPSGYFKDPAFPQNISLTRGQNLTVNATDPRRFKTIVLVCNEAGNTLYRSGITVDGDAVGSSVGSDTAVADGIDESKVCALASGSKGVKGGLRAAPDASNPHSASINIPNTQP